MREDKPHSGGFYWVLNWENAEIHGALITQKIAISIVLIYGVFGIRSNSAYVICWLGWLTVEQVRRSGIYYQGSLNRHMYVFHKGLSSALSRWQSHRTEVLIPGYALQHKTATRGCLWGWVSSIPPYLPEYFTNRLITFQTQSYES